MATTKASATRTTILELAVQIASTEGLEGLTIGHLAGELRMSKSGLFAHFGSKQELQIATIQTAAQRYYEEVVVPAQVEQEGWRRLRSYCDRYLDFLEREVFAGGCFWASAAAEFDDRPGAVRDSIQVGVTDWLGELERQARIGGARDPVGLAFEIYSIGLGANTCSRLLEDKTTFSRAAAAIDRRLAAEEAGAES